MLEATTKLDIYGQLTQQTGFLPQVTQIMREDILDQRLLLLYIIFKSFSERFCNLNYIQSIAQQFSQSQSSY